jgi:branched-chain amino acid transport system ATP-binding protein
VSALLEGRRLTRAFGGVPAVQEVDFQVADGEMVGLIGPNGAGKTTLLNLVSGLLRPDRGEIRFRGERISGLPPDRITRLGIGRTFQIVQPFPGLSVRQNVAVGALFGAQPRPRSTKEALLRADEALQQVGLHEKRSAPLTSLTLSDRKRLEVARALTVRPRLLLLDEVMAGLNLVEIEAAMQLVRSVHQNGVSILVIEHVMKAIMGLCTRVLVLHEGRLIAEGTPQEVVRNPRVVEAYLGERYARRSGDGG